MRSREGGPPPEELMSGGKNEKKDKGEGGIPRIPEGEFTIEFVRSSGPGGQKVNKTSSKAQLRWEIGASDVLNDDQKELVRALAGNRVNNEGEIVLSADTERSQLQNKNAEMARLQNIVDEALTPQKERKATKPSKGAIRRRLDEKTRHGKKKEGRKKPSGGWE